MNQRQIGGKKKLIFQAKWFGIDENKFFAVLSLPNSA